MQQSYDVIIVGAGSAGCPLAARLSEDPSRSVLLLEAGPRFESVDQLPPELRYGGVLSAMMPDHPNNWNLVATVREGLIQPLPRGRVVGGSSALNGTLFTRGLPEDFDGWAAAGNPDWSYENVLPFFKKLETDHDVHDAYHGGEGPMPVRRASAGEIVPIDRAFMAACRAAGHPDDPDLNGPKSIGVGLLPVNNVNGVRMNTALTYLDPANDRPNLTVRGNVLVRRIVLDGRKAVGVEVEIDGQASTIHAGEIVLSAGAVMSPQLLMLSGIGPADELRRVNIPVLHELPLVGRQFTDHCTLALPFRVRRNASPMPDPTRSAWAHVALHYTSKDSPDHSDMSLMQSAIPTIYCVFHSQSLLRQAQMLKSTLGKISLSKLMDYAKFGWSHAITMLIQRGASRGEIRLNAANPAGKPELLYNYLSRDIDLRRMREAIRLTAGIIASAPYRELGAERLALSDADLDNDAALDAFTSRGVGTSIHMAGTCQMGPSAETAVVDQHCRVHGIEGLRVVDTSIMPTVVRRCPAATAVMLGERAAAFFN